MLDFTISSNSFEDMSSLPMEQVLNMHGCTGKNISPDLKWENAPLNTKEFALIVHDPDAPVPNGWYHWIVLKIPATVTSFSKGIKISSPMREAKTSFTDVFGYGGACPPIGHGVHHYNFVIYALDTLLDSSLAEKKPTEIEAAVKSRSIKSAKITALYQR
ncbi:MAG: YbhB/YbcL family Raf kinase inhibitor-like protein [Candidatus Gastranaerophilales bacterium]|nr:YbhB/YbcL family Raf kinase inhibitor-like protein [Candidatus Gastranaerophilales bacterium]